MLAAPTKRKIVCPIDLLHPVHLTSQGVSTFVCVWEKDRGWQFQHGNNKIEPHKVKPESMKYMVGGRTGNGNHSEKGWKRRWVVSNTSIGFRFCFAPRSRTIRGGGRPRVASICCLQHFDKDREMSSKRWFSPWFLPFLCGGGVV